MGETFQATFSLKPPSKVSDKKFGATTPESISKCCIQISLYKNSFTHTDVSLSADICNSISQQGKYMYCFLLRYWIWKYNLVIYCWHDFALSCLIQMKVFRRLKIQRTKCTKYNVRWPWILGKNILRFSGKEAL